MDRIYLDFNNNSKQLQEKFFATVMKAREDRTKHDNYQIVKYFRVRLTRIIPFSKKASRTNLFTNWPRVLIVAFLIKTRSCSIKVASCALLIRRRQRKLFLHHNIRKSGRLLSTTRLPHFSLLRRIPWNIRQGPQWVSGGCGHFIGRESLVFGQMQEEIVHHEDRRRNISVHFPGGVTRDSRRRTSQKSPTSSSKLNSLRIFQMLRSNGFPARFTSSRKSRTA